MAKQYFTPFILAGALAMVGAAAPTGNSTVAENDVFTQAATGMKFPASVGTFKRTDIRQYDKDGLDMSAGYEGRFPEGRIVATVYVFPSPAVVSLGSPAKVVAEARTHVAEQAFKEKKAEILGAHAQSRLTSDSAEKLEQPGLVLSGYRAMFTFVETFSGQPSMVTSRVDSFYFVADKWTVEYRFTYLPDEKATERIETFMRALIITVGKAKPASTLASNAPVKIAPTISPETPARPPDR